MFRFVPLLNDHSFTRFDHVHVMMSCFEESNEIMMLEVPFDDDNDNDETSQSETGVVCA